MNDIKHTFEFQCLTVVNELATVELLYESFHSENKRLEKRQYNKTIKLTETEYGTSLLSLMTTLKNGEKRTCLLMGIEGGIYLHSGDNNGNDYSVKLENQILYCSLGFTFLAFDILSQNIKWEIKPEITEIFEFYDLEDDFLVRGELSIHRIDKNGNIKWHFGGRDIWVSIDGQKEVIILEDRILLTDFEGNEYEIDFKGNILTERPKIKQIERTKRWWKIW